MDNDQDDKIAADEILENLQALMRDSEALLKATASYADDRVQQARARAEESVNAAKQRFAGMEDELIGKVRDFANVGSQYLRDNPWASLGIAAAIGFALGALVARRPAGE